MDGLVASPLRLPLPRRRLRLAADDRIVGQIRSGDPAGSRAAFEALYDRHHRGLLAYCRHLLGSQEEAEDALQHTFSAAYAALLRDERDVALRAWLYTIARNRCLSILSARREQVELDAVEAVLPATTGLAAEVQQRADLRELLADLQRLPEAQRSALILSELQNHSHEEIAEILGVRPAKVKALVFQAREALMISRQARETDCTVVREQLSVLRGSSLRRRELRRHVEGCAGCRAFELEVRRQRAGMALLLPVAPTLALKHGSIAAAFAAAGSGAAAATSATGGGTIVAGGLAVGAKSIGAKSLATLAFVTGTGGGGYVAVQDVARESPAAPPAKVQSPSEMWRPAQASAATNGAAGVPVTGRAGEGGGGDARAGDTARGREPERGGDRDKRGGRAERGAGVASAKNADRPRGAGAGAIATGRPGKPGGTGHDGQQGQVQSSKPGGGANGGPSSGAAAGTGKGPRGTKPQDRTPRADRSTPRAARLIP